MSETYETPMMAPVECYDCGAETWDPLVSHDHSRILCPECSDCEQEPPC